MAKFTKEDLSVKVDGRFYYGWVMLLIGFLFMFIPFVIKVNCSSLFLTPICEEFGVTRTVYVQTNTIMTVCMLIGSSFIGKLLSKFRLKYILPLLAAGVCLCYVLMGQAQNMWHLYILCGIQGFLWAGMTNLPVNVMVSSWFGPKVKGTAMSTAFLGSGVGALVWVPIMKGVMAASGWRTAYLAMAGGVAIMIPVCFFLCVNLPDDMGFSRRIGDPSKAEIEATGGKSITKRGLSGGQIIRLPRYWCQFLAAILVQICNTAFTSQCVAYFTDLGVENGAALYAAAVGTLTFGKFFLGFFADVLNVKRIVTIAPFAAALTFVSLAMCKTNMAWSTGVIIGYMVLGSLPTLPALLTSRNFGEKDYALVSGWNNMSGNIGQIIGPILLAAFFDVTGTYQTAWWILGCLMVVVSVLYYLSTVINAKKIEELGYVPTI